MLISFLVAGGSESKATFLAGKALSSLEWGRWDREKSDLGWCRSCQAHTVSYLMVGALLPPILQTGSVRLSLRQSFCPHQGGSWACPFHPP